MRVLALESRRAAAMAELIRRRQGDPFVAPSMREAPLASTDEAFRFAARLFSGEFDMMVFLTGVGTRALRDALAPQYSPERFAGALRALAVVARGPKPAAALREMGVPVTVPVPAPHTWREILAATEGRPEKRVAVQEYGRPNPDLLRGLQARGAEVTPVRVYRWDLPEDLAPLREAVRRIASGEIDVVLFTAAVQAVHLFRIASTMGLEAPLRQALAGTVIASIGPATTEVLEDFGLVPDVTPAQSKMGVLVSEAAERAGAVLARKRL